ncbi:MAG: hypothetical protein ACYTDT_00230 [Planctomycetota bacterium]|jgi:hypothetical protein
MSEKPRVDCDCGWSGDFENSQAGVQIECPECGKIHRVPTFSGNDESVDVATLNRLLGRENTPSEVTTVNFAPLFKLSCVVGLVVIVCAFVFVRSSLPATLGVAGIGLGWPLGVGWAWYSQTRFLRKLDAAH